MNNMGCAASNTDPSVPQPTANSYPRSQNTETRWIQPNQTMTLPPSGHNIRNSRNEDAVIAAAALMHYGGHHHGLGPRMYNPVAGDYGLL
ncbi:uncharacterized protein LOC125682005 isoform X2 [Ostrea edulis]|uniref:uncharacterized protein LOC125682005 isoform X2 n=1 Tax=Ostrea edulis TaxID=37623 RepID=UPI002095E6C0|nr:uncharacterized protein LOC125682005 isoform X2 [Ostrea edulis]